MSELDLLRKLALQAAHSREKGYMYDPAIMALRVACSPTSVLALLDRIAELEQGLRNIIDAKSLAWLEEEIDLAADLLLSSEPHSTWTSENMGQSGP